MTGQACVPAQVAMLSAELERTREAAKGDMRLRSMELQGLREQQAALRSQQDAAQARAALLCTVLGTLLWRPVKKR